MSSSPWDFPQIRSLDSFYCLALTRPGAKFSSFSLPHPEGSGPPSKMQIQPVGAPPPFRASIFSYQLVPPPEMPTRLSLPTKRLLGLQDPIRKSNVTHQVCDIFICLPGRLCLRVPILFSVLSVTALATPCHIYRNFSQHPAFPPRPCSLAVASVSEWMQVWAMSFHPTL